MRPLGRLEAPLLALGALALSVHAALTAGMTGDYPGDGGPAISALLHGNMTAFAEATPAMGALSLLIRAPFAAIAYLGHASELAIYRWGSLPCTLSVAVLALWLARIAVRRGAGRAGAVTVVLAALVNPLVGSAMSQGHPEELMTASLCVGALVAACERRSLLSALLLGLALACKQWAIVCVLPVMFALERDRLRALAGAIGLAALVTIPEAAGAPVSFLRNQLLLAHTRAGGSTILSWWWPLAPERTLHTLVQGSSRTLLTHRLPAALVGATRPLMIGVVAAIAALAGRVRGLPLRRGDAFALMAIVLLLRCTLDTQTMPYYHEALFLDLLAWDALEGLVIPWRALLAWSASYVIADWLSFNGIGASYSLVYAAITMVGLVLLATSLVRRGRVAARTPGGLAPATG